MTLPKHYYNRGKYRNDRDWLLSRMVRIPEEKRQEVADEYSRIYLSRGVQARKAANAYLNGIAREYAS